MSAWLNDLGLGGFVTPEQLSTLLRAVLILVIGLLAARLVAAAAGRTVGARMGKQESMLARRFVFYGLTGLTLAMTLNELGFQLSVLLGAAGILTVAIGFASQTSASNLISGLFLIAERPFVVGDVITVEGQTGEVLSIDLLSVKLRTFDNLYVRVPNESIIKARVTNLTHFPIRRADLKIGVAYKEDLPRVRRILMRVADANPLCLDEPEPLFIFTGYGDSSLDMQFSVWGKRENFLELRNRMYLEIKAAFDAEGVEIPFPHRSLYAGEATRPIPVRMVDAGES
jgi:small-conductance mechanosensitive channel